MKQSFKQKNLDYKWVIITLCFLMVFISLGFCSSNRSLYLSAITDALDLSRSSFSVSDSIRYISTAIANLFFGALVARFGTKKLICAGFICLIAFSLTSAFATNIFAFYLAGAFLGIGLSWTTTAMVGYVVTKWSRKNKGTVMGAILAANGLGGALAAQIITPMIFEQGNPFGYRNAYYLVAILLACVCVLFLLFFRENPKNTQAEDSTAKGKASDGQNWEGIEYSSAIRKPFFYGAIICIFFTGLVLQGVTGVAATHMKDIGLNASYIAITLSIHSIALTLFKFLTGFIYDKFGLRATVTTCVLGAIITMTSLSLVTPTTEGMVFALVYSVISALALPLETVMLPIYASDLFGEKSFNKIMGIFISANTAGYALGAVAINAVFDCFGDYTPAFIICAVIMVFVLVAMQFILTAAHRTRKSI